MDRRRVYWLCQIAGWFLVGAVGVAVHPENWAPGEIQTTLLNWALGVAIGIGMTHLFRTYAKGRGWARLPIRRLAPRIVGAALLLGAAAAGVETAAVAADLLDLPADSRSQPRRRRLLNSFLGGFLLMGAWMFIYFGTHAAWNYRQAEIDRWKLQAQAEAARLEALKLQLNPHFFFNSLASVRALISEAPGRAKTMVARLARLLREALQASGKDTVPLEEELATTKTYLRLEKVRFEDRLDWRIDAEEEALRFPVPHMLVQTLTENAVKHGVAQRQGGGVVQVEAAVAGETEGDDSASGESPSGEESREENSREGNSGGKKSTEENRPLYLKVTNPGELGEEAGAERGSGADHGSGTGLENARERLRLLFGEGASLGLEQSGPETVTATARLPRPPGASGAEASETEASGAEAGGTGADENGHSEAQPGQQPSGQQAVSPAAGAPGGAADPSGAAGGAAGDGSGASSPAPNSGRPSVPPEREAGNRKARNGGSDAARERSWTRLLTGRLSYWVCQALGWGSFGASVVLISKLGESLSWTELLGSVLRAGAFVGAGVGLTHAFRIYAKRQSWTTLPPRRLVPRATAAAVVLGSAYVLITSPIALELADSPTEWGPWLWAALGQMAPPAISFSILMGLWIAIYFSVRAARNYRQAEIDRWKLQARAETARLEALRLQLNPHFFFNCLASVRSLISEAPGRARRMVGRLARLLREALEAGDEKTVPLEEELSATETYLKLEQVRFEDRLGWTIDASEEALQRQVPYMLVQTLVENAVGHGIEQHRAGGTIRIEATAEAEASAEDGESPLRLRVTNPGQLGEEAGSGRGSGAERGSGTGLENARERLRLLFGEAASLALEQSGPQTVTATARIPRPAALDDRLPGEGLPGEDGFSDLARIPAGSASAGAGSP